MAACFGCSAALAIGDRRCSACGRDLSPAELAATGATPPLAVSIPTVAVPPPVLPTPPPAVPTPPPPPPAAGPIGLESIQLSRPARTSGLGSSASASRPNSGPGNPVVRGVRRIGRGLGGCLMIFLALGVLGVVLDSIGGDGATRATPRPTARVTVRATTSPELSAQSTARVVMLAEAIDGGLVDMLANGRNLEVLDVTLTSLVDEPLSVVVPAGLLFAANSRATQSMVVTVEETIDLAPGEELSWPLNVACARMHLDQPSEGDTFTIATAPATLRKLVTSDAFAEASFRIEQFAIWTITDNPTQGDYLGLGVGGVGSGPDDEEIAQIKAMLNDAGIDPSDYRALR